MDRPLILITTWRRRLPTFLGEQTTLETLDPAYADRVADAGGQPLLLSRSAVRDPAEIGTVLAAAHGLVITGGGDVDPVSYGGERENVAGDDAVADAFELRVLGAARVAELPTLAICRGAQLLAIAAGGGLSQRAGAGGSHAELDGMAAEQILAARHPVALAAGSRVRRAFADRGELLVNTVHHHHIADPGDLLVTATAPDGVIEAVEPRDRWACVGVQWHPEKMAELEQRCLFEQLVANARRRQSPRSGEVARRAA